MLSKNLSEPQVSALRNLLVYIGAIALYFICLDRGASLWDCPEYILIAWRLEIGHPPGNPTWQLVANVLSHLGGSAQHAAVIINAMSAVAMALAAMFLSGISYIFLRASIFRGRGRLSVIWANVCAGAGALCYAWCDSAIFSAVEAEVYALSAMFTALMLWVALLWARKRRRGDIAGSRRYIILIFYLAGLGVGVHELNFLILPAIVLVFWFGWREGKRVPAGDVPDSRSAHEETVHRKLRFGWVPTVVYSAVLFCIGATTYLIIPIRANANPPVNQGDPSTWERFMAYYGRDQYGYTPLLYGRTPYSEPLLREEYDSIAGRFVYNTYAMTDLPRGRKEYLYPDELNMWLPRMTSSRPADIEFYEVWAGMTPDEMVRVEAAQVVDTAGNQNGKVNNLTGEREWLSTLRPTYWQQAKYMAKYQIGYMYLRYLMWNFSGRQNNKHSTGEREHGQFITGFPVIDNAMLGDQSELPERLREANRGYNRYFMIPLFFGLVGAVGLLFRGRPGRRVWLVIATFFIFTGVLIVVYLNQSPGEPRERDYSFLGSFMAFAVWISCGMAIIVKPLLKRSRRSGGFLRRPAVRQVVAALICLGVPLQMLTQTYDDHYRPAFQNAEDVIELVLKDVEPNAIVLANGDNLIFPLWYAQEVLGIRRDITVVARPYIASEWYRAKLREPGEGAPGILLSDTIPSGPGARSNRAVQDMIDLNRDRRPIYSASRIAPAVKL